MIRLQNVCSPMQGLKEVAIRRAISFGKDPLGDIVLM